MKVFIPLSLQGMMTLGCWILLLVIGACADGRKIDLLNQGQCRVVEERSKTLELKSVDSFLLTYDLSIDFANIFEGYQSVNDIKGTKCLLALEERLNRSISSFNSKVDGFQSENTQLFIYLNDESFIGKRSPVAIFMAVMVTICNVFISSLNLVMTSVKTDEMNSRLQAMSNVLENMKATQVVFNDNLEFIYEKEQFLGMEQALIVGELNQLAYIHSCELLALNLETVVSQIESQLGYLLTAVQSGVLTRELVDRDTLERISMNNEFSNTIYRISPSLLYDLSKINLVAFKDNKLTFLVSFPIISREYTLDYFDIIGSKTSDIHSFLLPIHMSYADATYKDFLSTNACLKHSKFIACPEVPNEQVNLCLLNDTCFYGTRNKEPFTYHYSHKKQSVLIELHNGGEVFDIYKSKTVYKALDNEKICAYFGRRQGLILKSDTKFIPLFPTIANYHVQQKVVLPNLHLVKFTNFTLPPRVSEKKYVRVIHSKADNVDYVFIICILSAIMMAMLLSIAGIAFCFYKCKCKCCCRVDAMDLINS